MKKLSFPLIFVLLLVSCMFFPFTACGEKEYTMEDCFEVIQYDPASYGVITLADLMLPTSTKTNSKFYTADEDVPTRDVIVSKCKELVITQVSYYDQYHQKEVVFDYTNDTYSEVIGGHQKGSIINIGFYDFVKGMHNLKIEFEVIEY